VDDRVIDLSHDEADLGVRCGLGNWPGVKATHMMDEEVIAVCSPRLLPDDAPVTIPWIAGATLIHDSTPHPGAKFPSWDDWLTRVGVNKDHDDQGLHINSTSAVIQAALAARGLALVRKALVLHHLESGRLRQLMPECRLPIRWAYYVVASARSLRKPEVKAFHDWLLEQAQTVPGGFVSV
jgi:LysR family glycine cleavage system transcriptional activator